MLTISKLDLFLELVYIPGGSFMMGSPDTEVGRDTNEGPLHQVTLQPFYMSKYPITQKQYEEIMGTNPSNFKGDNLPVEKVNWNEATNFCTQLSARTEGTYRLPSESEWEYACRAGTTTPYYFGESITTELANYNGSSETPAGENRAKTTEVGIFPSNAFGLYDMHGNLWEWCQDDGDDSSYVGAPDDGSPRGNGASNLKVIRGGSWYHDAEFCRSANRGRIFANTQTNYVGFRVVYMPGL